MLPRNGLTKESSHKQTISLVVPVFNEQNGIQATYETLVELMESQDYAFEIVVSDNGSTDGTEAIMQRIAARDTRCKYVRLSRNFGYQNNITVGMAVARGDAIVVIDSDLQDPVELIPVFIQHWQEGYDVPKSGEDLLISGIVAENHWFFDLDGAQLEQSLRSEYVAVLQRSNHLREAPR